MLVIDEYLSRANEALRSGDSGQIDAIAREIVSAFHSEIPGISHYRGGKALSVSAPDLHSATDLKKLIGKLKVLRESKDEQLYGEYGLASITDAIRQLEDAIHENYDEIRLKDLYRKIDSVFANEYQSYTCGLSGWGIGNELKASELETRTRIEKLKAIRDREFRMSVQSAEQGQSFQINQKISATSSATAQSRIDFGATLDAVDSIPETHLSKEEKILLKGMLAELSQDVENNKQPSESKVKQILAWLADKSFDVIIGVTPYILQTIQDLG